MASALLANQNEPANWRMAQPRRGGSKMMGDVSFSNPKFSKKRQFHALTSQPLIDVDESPALMQPTVSDDASSINRRPSGNGGGRYGSSGCVTFNVASYSHKELIELKFRLVAELEQIRRLKSRIEGSDFAIRSNPNLQTEKPIKKLTGNKRSFPASKRDNTQLMKNCSQILSKLMKHKHGRYIFNSPVDVVGLQLHDYYDIIKHPMDLGTVKTRLGKNLYGSPQDFAADVRLTFDNAMKYNPKGHEVYVLAEQLLLRFEELFRPIQEKLGDDDDRGHEIEEVHEVQASSWDHSHSRVGGGGGGEMDWVRRDQENANQIEPTSGSTQNQNHNQNQSQNVQSTSQLPVRTPSPVRAPPVKPVKQPKPKAKDPNKREMTLEEKHKLGLGLQSLPQEKMEQVVQIIRKRNGDLRQDGDEIELDIETVDTETLWELDRFVTNYKKMVSKIKRQSLMGISNNVVGNPATENESNKDEIENERVEVPAEAKKPRKGDAGDEDVDIGDEMPMSSFPPVEIEKDNGNASSSSSSSGSSSDGSSSSSDSDSGSSSGSDSEDAHS